MITASLLFGVDVVHPVTGQVLASYENFGLQSSRSSGCPIGFSLVSGVCQRSNFDSGKNDGEAEQCCGNPINQGTGSKFQVEVDLRRSVEKSLELIRYYVSSSPFASPFGKSWRSNFDKSIGYFTGGSISTAVVVRGSNKTFYFNLSGGIWTSDSDVNYRLSQSVQGAVTYWKLATPENTIETYSVSTGKLLSVVDSDGYQVNLSYDGQEITSRLSSVMDSYGRSLVFTYDASNRVSIITDNQNKTYRYTYDSNGNLSTVTYPDGTVRSYLYESSGFANALTGILDENGARFATWAYDGQGRAISSQHANGAELVTISYAANSSVVTEALGAQRTYTFSNVLGVKKTAAVNGDSCVTLDCGDAARSYDVNGNVASRTDFNGYRTTYVYDLSRNLETQRKEGLNSDGSSRPESRTVSTTWHSYWRLPVKVAEPLKLTTWVYNGDTVGGQVVSCAPANATVPSSSGGTQPIGVLCRKIEQATTDSSGSQGLSATVTGTPRTWTWTYNAYGQPLTADGPRTDVADTTTYTYYDAADPDLGKRGNLATLTNALGQTTQISAYDGTGRPLTIIDPNGLTTQLSYDLRGRLLSKNVGGELTNYQYDGVGQLTQVTQPDGASLNYTYDPAHRLTQISDGQGNRIAYTLDAMGNRTGEQVSDPNGALSRQISRSYDALNRLQTITGALQ
jgi:YD repeat-containing protein